MEPTNLRDSTFGHFLLPSRRHRTFLLRCQRHRAPPAVWLNSWVPARRLKYFTPPQSGGQKANDASTRSFLFGIVAALLLSTRLIGETAETEAQIREGSQVSFEYTLSDETGTVIESNKGKQPMSYVHGKRQIIPGLEKELSGMKVGEEKKIQVKPEDGYGPINPDAFQEVPKDKLPPEALKVGTTLMAQGAQGQGIPVRVHEIKDTTVIMDFNHPMAGKTLSFDVKVSEIKTPEK